MDDGPAWIQPLLTAVRTTGVVSVAARRVGIGPATVYARRSKDPAFEAALTEALEEAVDEAEAEMMRRAVAGVEEPVVYQGALSYWQEAIVDPLTGETRWRPVLGANGQPIPLTINKRSDTLLMFALKGRRKEVYGTDRQELTGRDGAPLESAPRSEVEIAARVSALLELAKRRRDDDIL